MDETSDINFNENRSVESMASFNNDTADGVSTCATEIVKNTSTVQDDGNFVSEQNTQDLKRTSLGLPYGVAATARIQT